MATRSISFDRSILVSPALVSAPLRLWSVLCLLHAAYREALAMAQEAQQRGIFVE